MTFDPKQVTYQQLLKVFFLVAHNPTELNRQGPDTGTQHRSAIFYADESQNTYRAPIVTQKVPLKAFYPADDYHQDHLNHHPKQPYIVINDQPKVEHRKKGVS